MIKTGKCIKNMPKINGNPKISGYAPATPYIIGQIYASESIPPRMESTGIEYPP